jgi:dolichol kinase
MNNYIGLVIAYLYVFATIGVAEGLRRWRNYSNDFTRKFIHIGVGMLSWLVPFLFTSPWPFVIACLSFSVLNFLDWKYGFFSSMASSNPSNLGTVYFPIAAAFISVIFWEQPPLMVAALMPLTWGDGFASVIGKVYGRNQYKILGHNRSLEGSASFFVFGGIFSMLALWLVGGHPDISAAGAIVPALVLIGASTFSEAFSPWGLDNLTVPAISTIVLLIWNF